MAGATRSGLVAARKRKGYTQKSLAHALGVEPSTVGRWERATCDPHPSMWPRIAQELGITTDELAEALQSTIDGDHDVATTLKALLRQRHSQTYPTFKRLYEKTAKTIDSALVVTCPTKRQYYRWLNGQLLGLPHPGAQGVLEAMFPEYSAEQLFAPWEPRSSAVAPESDIPPQVDSVKRRSFLTASGAVVLNAALASSMPTHEAPSVLSAPTQGHWSKPIYDAVIDPAEAMRRVTTITGVTIGNCRALRQQVDSVMSESLSSNYGALQRLIPRLVGSIEATSLLSDGGPVVQQALSDLYSVIAWTLVKADCTAAAWIAAQRSIQAAERADDVLRIAAATRCLAEVYMRGENYEEAVRTALLASVYLEPLGGRQPVALSLRGAALLSAAAASARRGDSREAFATLKAASFCATELGNDRSDLATVFGPTNAAVHQVAIPLELGDARTAVRNIPNVRFEHATKRFAERRTRFLIDVARSYVLINEHRAAIDALVQAETIAPDELRHHRLTRELVPRLRTRESRNTELRPLAARCNLLT